jgi:hypothetical protein
MRTDERVARLHHPVVWLIQTTSILIGPAMLDVLHPEGGGPAISARLRDALHINGQ